MTTAGVAPGRPPAQPVRLEFVEGGIARLTLSRPERRNAISAETARAFLAAVADAEAAGATVIVLDAEGPAFCAGADLADLHASAVAVDEVVLAIRRSSACWIAAAAGAVRGAGLAVLDACPLVVAADTATFGLPELHQGFFPRPLLLGPLASVPPRAAFQLAFSGLPVDAERAHALDLVSRVVGPDELLAVALGEARRLVCLNPDAVADGVRTWRLIRGS